MAYKFSRQRECIKSFVQTRTDHPTAEVVYEHVKGEYPHISLGTVYRNLSLLSSLGELQKLSVGDGFDHFDPNIEPHYHFVCKKCGCIKDLPMNQVQVMDDLASEKFDGIIEGHTAFFTGLCKACITDLTETKSNS